MTKNRLPVWFAALVCLMGYFSPAGAEDRFALTVGPHDVLAIFGPKGEKIPPIPLPSFAVPVTVAGVSFQVSYGVDEDQRLTAILTPSESDPSDLHFNVLGKSVDADKSAVVTLIFSPNLRSVRIDPGYVGTVEVNSQRMRRRG